MIGVENTASMLHHTGFFLILFGSLYPTAKHTHTHMPQETARAWEKLEPERRRRKKSEAPLWSPIPSLISFISDWSRQLSVVKYD